MRLLVLLTAILFAPMASAMTVLVTVEPLAKLVRGLYGDAVTVQTLLQPNQNPHHLALSSSQLLALRRADQLIWLGADAEPALAGLVQRHQPRAIALLSQDGITTHYSDHAHEHDGDDDHGGHHHVSDHSGAYLDPHLWLSSNNLARLAQAIATRHPDELLTGQPTSLIDDLQAWSSRWQTRFAEQDRQRWLTYHDPWRYFYAEMGIAAPLTVTAQLDAGPGSREFVQLVRTARERNIRCALVEPEARQSMVRRVCPDCQVVLLDPIGRDRTDATLVDWLDELAASFYDCFDGQADTVVGQ